MRQAPFKCYVGLAFFYVFEMNRKISVNGAWGVSSLRRSANPEVWRFAEKTRFFQPVVKGGFA